MPDPFDTLGLPARFDLDPGAIQGAYLARAAACHPDLAGGDAEALAGAARAAAVLNAAKAVLLDPESRARALLARLDPGAPPDRSLPDGFLLDMMETRMGLERAIADEDVEGLRRWREWAARERGSYIGRVGGLLAGLGVAPAPEALAEVRRQLNAWRYIERMAEQMPAERA